MILPHNCHITEKSLNECIDSVMKDRSVEVDIAASKHFWDYEGDLDVPDKYDDYYATTVEELTKILGSPIYRGRWDTPDRDKWIPIIPEYADAMELAVWEKDSVKLYLRLSWEDKEIPIFIAMGTEGCEPTGIAYPGQF